MLVLSHHNIYLQLNVEEEPNLGMPLSLLGIRAYLTMLFTFEGLHLSILNIHLHD